MESTVVLLDGSATATPPAPRGFARYIGGVGALAVALGIGAAVATSPGIAGAAPDTTGSTGSSSASESSSAQQDSTSDTNTTDTAPVTETPKTATPATTVPPSGSDKGSTPAASPSDPRDGTVQASGGANTTVTTSDDTTTSSRVVTNSQAKASASATLETAKAKSATESDSVAAGTRSTESVQPTSTLSADTVTAAQAAVAPTPSAARMASTTAQPHVQPAPRPITTTALISPSPRPDAAGSPPLHPITTVVHGLTSFAAALASMVGLSPALTTDPVTPVEPPTPWVMLAWVRRQFEQTLFNESPLIGFGPVTSSQSVTGVV